MFDSQRSSSSISNDDEIIDHAVKRTKEIEIKNDKNTLLTKNSHAYKLVICTNIK